MGSRGISSLSLVATLAATLGLSGCVASDSQACSKLNEQIGILGPLMESYKGALYIIADSGEWNAEGMNSIADQFDRVRSDIEKIEGSAEFEAVTSEFTNSLKNQITFTRNKLQGFDASTLEADLLATAGRLRTVCSI
jgi:hypothetical protein